MRRQHEQDASLEEPFRRVTTAVSHCWLRGWQPADLAHVVGRDLAQAHRLVCVAAIEADADRYRYQSRADPGWLAQVDAVTAPLMAGDPDHEPSPLFGSPPRSPHDVPLLDRLTAAVGSVSQTLVAITALLTHLRLLPDQPRLCVPPSEWATSAPRRRDPSRAADPKITERVRALLAKAESTTFPDEAETFTAKAQELIARHAIDLALLEGGPPSDDVVGRRILIDDPYARPKSVLVSVIAKANRASAVFNDGLGFSTVFGQPSDLDAVEMLFTSLLTQATASMTAAGRRGGARARGRSFRQSFLLAFATRIGERLQAATSAAVEDARAVHGDNILPVLASQDAAATDARDAAFPRLVVGRRLTTSSPEGWFAGQAAADLAHLGPEAQLRA